MVHFPYTPDPRNLESTIPQWEASGSTISQTDPPYEYSHHNVFEELPGSCSPVEGLWWMMLPGLGVTLGVIVGTFNGWLIWG